MAHVIMPQLGETVTEGTVGKWLKKEGDTVAKYEPLLDIETDKVASEIPSPFAGVLTKILAQEGDTVPVGSPIAEIQEAGAKAAQIDASAAENVADRASRGPTETTNVADRASRGPTDTTPTGDGVRYSPAVRKLAREHGVDLGTISGSGKGGRITANDVMAAVQSRGAQPAATKPAAPTAPTAHAAPPAAPTVQPMSAPPPTGEDTVIKLTPIRKTIAERMAQSRFTIPYAWSLVEVDMTEMVRWRDREKAAFQAREGVNLTFVPIVVWAVSAAIREVPIVNSTWAGDHVIQRRRVNVGIAVDAPDGLIVPVVRDADKLSLAGLATTIHALVEKARGRKITMEELGEGTITVNNTGAIGSVVSLPIINPPQASIFAMEAIVKRPWVIGDAIAIRSIMNISVGFDHRVYDGGSASKFLQAVRRRLETVPPAA